MSQIKICSREGCENSFEYDTLKPNKLYCDETCKALNRKAQDKEIIKQRIKALHAAKIEDGITICEYGCGNPGLFVILHSQKLCCSRRCQSCPTIKELNRKGVQASYSSGTRIPGTEVYQNMPLASKQKMLWSKGKILVSPEMLFAENTKKRPNLVKQLFREESLYHCGKCKITEWNEQPITLELHHINGQNTDNRRENLILLCPNCHSQTNNFAGKNIDRNKACRTDEEVIEAIQESKTIHQALIKLGLTPKGANYRRMYELIGKHNLQFKQ